LHSLSLPLRNLCVVCASAVSETECLLYRRGAEDAEVIHLVF
jgi:hypothetical protein